MMHVHFLDPYRPYDSQVHKLDPRIKLVLAIMFILTNALLPSGAWPVYLVLLALILSIEVLSELGISYVLRRSILAFPFVLAALPLILTVPGKAIFNLPFGQWTVVATYAGLEHFISIAAKAWLSIQVAIVLASSTSFPDLLAALRAIGVPRLLVSIFGLMWRYLFVFADEATHLMRARAARSGRSDDIHARTGGSLTWRARVTGGMAGNLLLRAFDRSDRIYMAMVSRGYDGEVRNLPYPGVQATQWIVLFVNLGLLAVLLGSAYVFWG